MEKKKLLESIHRHLIVSCQALEDEPLHGSDMMSRMAVAAQQGGAAAIRANGKNDIIAIKEKVGLPMIGIVKREYPDSDVYITPTLHEVKELIEAGVDIIAIDATGRRRPNDEKLENLLAYIRSESGCLAMADISTKEEGVAAAQMGFDLISTTLSGYTAYSRDLEGPDFQLIRELSASIAQPVIAEGKIYSPEEAAEALACGAYAVVVGSAITRPQILTRRFANQIRKEDD